MSKHSIEVIVVGGGQAGLGISQVLQQSGVDHIVFEKGRVGETWLSQRWDSFQLNTPNDMNTLPGMDYEGKEPDGFWAVPALIQYFKDYVDQFNLPIKTGVTVTGIRRVEGRNPFLVDTRDSRDRTAQYECRAVVIASGNQNIPQIPPQYQQLANGMVQLHAAEYKNAAGLPPGAVVVVGSGQTGVQICEDLLKAGRQIYLCTSKVGRAPRKYRGKDILHWMREMKYMEVAYASLEDPSMAEARQPLVSGVGRYGHTVSLQSLSRRGVKIVGKLLKIEKGILYLGDQARENVRFGDRISQDLKDSIDSFSAQAGVDPSPLEPDPADEPDPLAACVTDLREIDLAEAGIRTVIWATGYRGDFHWLNVPGALENGSPRHSSGVSPVSGLYFLGFPWLHARGSGILYGINNDSHIIADEIIKHLAEAQ